MTSNHEGVSCDLCRKNNFKGLRYKCLVCYDYDLCSACYDGGLASSRHTNDHPMQCIVARNDFELFYSGESISSDHPQSLTCPLCGHLGYTESSLLEHVTHQHANSDNDTSSAGIVCPVCGVETNQLTYDFATHLTMEHRTPRDQMEQVAIRGRGARCHARSSGPRGRRSQPHYNPIGGPSGSSPSSAVSRDSTDPLVEIMAQLSSIRRAGGCGTGGGGGGSGGSVGAGHNGGGTSSGLGSSSSNPSHASQLHQLQMRLQSSQPSYSQRAAAAAANTSHQDREVRITRRTFQSINNNSSLSNSIGSLGGGAYATGVGTHYSSSQPFMLIDQCALGRAGVVSSGSIGSGNGGGGGITGGHSTATTATGIGLVGASGLAVGSGVGGGGGGIGGLAGGVQFTGNQQGNCTISTLDGTGHPQLPSQYLLSSCMKPTLSEAELQQREILKADRSLFVQDLLLQVGLLEKSDK